MSKHVFWINSFPKSGNTLLRAIISALFFSKDGKFTFDLIRNISQFEMSERLNFVQDTNESDFKKIEDIYILSKYLEQAQTKTNLKVRGDFFFLKTHYNYNLFNKNFFTSDKITRGYIYIVRDPRDVVISWSKFANVSIEDSIDFVINDNSCIRWSNKSENSKIPKTKFPKVFVSSWNGHVNSWTNNNLKAPNLIIKYEDLILKKENVIKNIKVFFKDKLNITINDFETKLENIIITTSFNYMQNMESKLGFGEAKPWSNFFHRGKKKQWIDILTSDQVKIIEQKCKKNLQKFNYL